MAPKVNQCATYQSFPVQCFQSEQLPPESWAALLPPPHWANIRKGYVGKSWLSYKDM